MDPHNTGRPRVVAWNIATLDGRIASSRSIPAWLGERWAPAGRDVEYVDIAAIHDATVILTGSNNFVARDAGPALLADEPSPDGDFLPADVLSTATRWMAVIDSRGLHRENRPDGSIFLRLIPIKA